MTDRRGRDGGMRVHLQRDIEKLKRAILALSAEVEDDVRVAVKAVEQRDAAFAEQVVRREEGVNSLEVDIEEECLKILALHQPVAGDLRYIIGVLKINNDLERIGDLAVHIAERGMDLGRLPVIPIPFRLGEMAEKTEAQLKKVLDAFVNVDAEEARQVCAADREIDTIHVETVARIEEAAARDPELFHSLLQIMHISRHLERIGDHAKNIAEDLIYMVEGKIVRHTLPT